MSNIVTIKLNAEIDNMDLIRKQIDELQNKLAHMKVNLTIKEDVEKKIEEKAEEKLTLRDVVRKTLFRSIELLIYYIDNEYNLSDFNDFDKYIRRLKEIERLVVQYRRLVNEVDTIDDFIKIDEFVDNEADRIAKLNRKPIQNRLSEEQLLKVLDILVRIKSSYRHIIFD